MLAIFYCLAPPPDTVLGIRALISYASSGLGSRITNRSSVSKWCYIWWDRRPQVQGYVDGVVPNQRPSCVILMALFLSCCPTCPSTSWLYDAVTWLAWKPWESRLLQTPDPSEILKYPPIVNTRSIKNWNDCAVKKGPLLETSNNAGRDVPAFLQWFNYQSWRWLSELFAVRFGCVGTDPASPETRDRMNAGRRWPGPAKFTLSDRHCRLRYLKDSV